MFVTDGKERKKEGKRIKLTLRTGRQNSSHHEEWCAGIGGACPQAHRSMHSLATV